MKVVFSILLFGFGFGAFSQNQVTFYFDSDKFELNKTELAKLSTWISANKTSKILAISASTDEIGSTGYNDTLSQKRVGFIYEKVHYNRRIKS